jgi:hypothetical protein
VCGPCICFFVGIIVSPTSFLKLYIGSSAFTRTTLLHSKMGKGSLKRQRDPNHGGPEDGVQAKRRRPKDGDTVKLSQLYNDLTAESEETRLEAAQQFITKFALENEPQAEELRRAIVRLVRGLCSARKAARLGFFVTLTELLRQNLGQQGSNTEGSKLGVDGLINLFEENTKVEKSASGKVVARSTILMHQIVTEHLGKTRSLTRETVGIQVFPAVGTTPSP